MTIDIDTLLAPLSETAPTGRDLREGGPDTPLYYQIKDARSAARLSERQADSDAERGGPPNEWRTVHDLAQTILGRVSKDIEVAVWLIEAALRLDGFAGLRESMAVLDGLVERYWPTLHSLDAEDMSAKVAPIAGLNGVGAEGSLIQPLRLAPFTDRADGEPVALYTYLVSRKRGPESPQAAKIVAAVRGTPSSHLIATYKDIAASHASYVALTTRLDAHCGADAPPSSSIRTVLEEAMDAMRDVARDALSALATTEDVAPPAAAPLQTAEPTPAPPPTAAPTGPAPMQTREDALRELARIAAFFHEHEPNSPTAYSIETVIRRARLTLAELLIELIPEEASRRTYLDMAGIRPAGP